MIVREKTFEAYVRRGILYITLTFFAFVVMLPFFWMLITAIKPNSLALSLKIVFEKPVYKNFIDTLFNPDYPFYKYFFNSLYVSFSGALLTCILASLAGYVFSKKDFYGKKILFWFLLSTLMVPGMMFFIPQFAIVTKLNWINTYSGMIIPHVASVFGVFLVKQYFDTIPNSLIESARIDGAGELTIFLRIMVPLSLPILITLFLLSFIFHWSNFLWHLVVNTPESDKLTLPIGLALFRGQYEAQYGNMMAGATLSILPVVILFLIAQRFFIKGLTQGAIKE